MILLDTSGLLSALFPDQRRHLECARAILDSSEPLILSPFVLAELDFLIGKLAGVQVELDLLGEVARGAYRLAPFTDEDVEQTRSVISRYRKSRIGLADASIVVLSRRFRTLDVLTLDDKHFSALRGVNGRPFRILPRDL